MPIALELPHRHRLPLRRLVRASPVVDAHDDPLDADTPVDRTKPFVAASLTPLYYTKVYAELAPAHVLRYNQLMGMLQNEVIAFFESAFAANVLGATGRGDVDADLAACLRAFLDEETYHTALWRRLNRLSDPRYTSSDDWLLRMPRVARALLDGISRRPGTFPMILWVMLIMEERSIEISRRYARAADGELEPHYAAVYRWHLEDEVRHVQIDWHLLERTYARCGPVLRRVNAAMLNRFLLGFFRTPKRSSARVVAALATEFPELNFLVPRMNAELQALSHDAAYGRMMYSDAVNPIAFGLMEHFPELSGLRESMRTGLVVSG